MLQNINSRGYNTQLRAGCGAVTRLCGRFGSLVNKPGVEKAVRDLLLSLGDDPEREGLKETPKRVANMYEELLSGQTKEAAEILKYFDEGYNQEMVVVKDITFHSVCEHHLLPFFGEAHICYIPAPGRLLGLSKIARVVELFARRLQLQEKLGSQIADFLEGEAGALGTAVIIEAEHMCISMRGINKPGSKTVTTALRGALKANKDLRAEALQLLNKR